MTLSIRDKNGKPADADIIATHGRMFFSAGGRFALRSFARGMRMLENDPLDTFIVSHVLWRSMKFRNGSYRQRIWDLSKAVPETVLTPVRAVDIARWMRIPHETARRALKKLTERGVLAREGRGYVPHSDFRTAPASIAHMLQNIHDLAELVQELQQAGLLQFLLDHKFELETHDDPAPAHVGPSPEW